MKITYRKYERKDYRGCEDLVNSAWRFNDIFESKNLRKIAKYLYTRGSLVSSNYKMVAVYQGTVVGFIFGYSPQRGKNLVAALAVGLRATFDLNFKKMDNHERDSFVDAIKTHQKNRSTIMSKKNNEIVLFAVSSELQGAGIGTNLWLEFRDFCRNCSNSTIQVETNKIGASSFYERLGFHHVADFDSPLHNLATKGGQACVYEYVA